MNVPAIGYARVSTALQVAEGVSLDAQAERIRAYCLASGLHLVEVVREEGVSGGRPLGVRDGGRRLLDALRRKRARHVIALKLDRLFRNTEDALRETRRWDHDGIALHVVDLGGQAVATSSPIGRMLLTLLAAVGELERGLGAERTKVALAHKRARGQVYGPVPFGLDRDGDELKPNRREQRALRKMRVWRSHGLTMREIAKRLTTLGVRTKRGGRWDCGTVSYILRHAG